MTKECPSCGRINPGYIYACKCGHRFEGDNRQGDATAVEISGKELVCSHCSGSAFLRSRAQLNTGFATFLDLDWLNESAEVFACAECGRLEWFVQPKITS